MQSCTGDNGSKGRKAMSRQQPRHNSAPEMPSDQLAAEAGRPTRHSAEGLSLTGSTREELATNLASQIADLLPERLRGGGRAS